MPLTMHAASANALTLSLTAMLRWLDKAEAHAVARKFEPNNYLGMRLAPDMLPLSRQVQIATDQAKGCMARLAGQEPQKWEDTEATLDELRARIRKALDLIASTTAAQIDGSEGREIVIKLPRGDVLNFTGESYLRQWVLPNFYFHVTAAYMLLRHAGVELGKADFLGR